ncbi:hypothetical protein ZOSMA_169G00480 [Zostera marina]|uniref:RING-type E3 ubiquitin transferase n=1 Tax=Zostera marina TaxID=29655 RepID=A0A0K9PTG4_ZOSMR|nr:hypothetical protein ZOSMA_169G00480 [Zostera marina]
MENKNLNKRASSSGGGFSHKRTNFSHLRDSKDGDGGINIQSCNRLGCSTRFNKNSSIKGDGIGNNNTDKKLKNPKSILCTSNNKTFFYGSSSKSSSSSSSNKKEQKKLKSVSEIVVPAESNDRGSEVGFIESAAKSGNLVQSSMSMNIKSSKGSRRVLGSSSYQGRINNPSSHEPRKVNNSPSLSSVSDVSSSSWSSSTMPIRFADTQRKRSPPNASPNASSSSSSSSSTFFSSSSSTSFGSRMNFSKDFSKDHRIQVVGTSMQPSATSQRTRSRPSMSKDNKPSLVTTKKTATIMNQPARMAGSSGSGPSSITRPPRLSIRESAPISTRRTGMSAASSAARSNHIRAAHHREDNGIAQMSGVDDDDDDLPQLETNEFTEALRTLELIESAEGMTHRELQQRLAYENTLILGALGLHDQHRELRLDIDDMSYEDLLDLGEKMGTVSTALTEEALAKCMKKSTYGHNNTSMETAEDDIKCSICQEEYIVGDKVGKLMCGHLYHVACIYKWLRQKNWCPICKAPACSMS